MGTTKLAGRETKAASTSGRARTASPARRRQPSHRRPRPAARRTPKPPPAGANADPGGAPQGGARTGSRSRKSHGQHAEPRLRVPGDAEPRGETEREGQPGAPAAAVIDPCEQQPGRAQDERHALDVVAVR